MRRRRASAGMSCALALVGCSAIYASNPKTWHPERDPECSTDTAAPVADTLIALASAVAAAALVYRSTADDACAHRGGGSSDGATQSARCILLRGAGIAGAGMAIGFGFSANVGFGRRSRCRKASSIHADWLDVNRPAPNPEPARSPARPPKPGELGGYCIGLDKCNEGLACNSETERCEEPAPPIDAGANPPDAGAAPTVAEEPDPAAP